MSGAPSAGVDRRPAVTPARGGGRLGGRNGGRFGATLTRSLAVLLVLLLAGVAAFAWPMVSDAAWRTAWAEAASPAPAAALATGPVMVLGGSPTRLPLALTLDGVPGEERPLVVSAGAVDDWRARGGSCDDPHVTCVMPDPSSTYGEALALDALAAAHGWDAVTVVTSDFHVARTRWQMAACTDVTTVVVAPGARPFAEDNPRLERLKLVNAGLRTSCRGRTP